MSIKRTGSHTLGSVQDGHHGASTGFDYLRIVLAVAVICWHSIIVVDGRDVEAWAGGGRTFAAIILPMFFCLSGFLVAGSLQRTPLLKDFLLLRAIRIMPALAVEVLLSALILGVLVTSLPLSEYLSSDVFRIYFLNIFGHIQYHLPGVFETNPFAHIVNLSLWTVPFELECYIALSVLILLKWERRVWLFVMLSALAILWLTFDAYAIREAMQSLRPKGKGLILAFLLGVLCYHLRYRIVYSPALFWGSLTLSLVLLSQAWLQYLALPLVAYVTVYLGLQNPPRKTFVLRGDYSYGLYLFAFPLQQLQVQLMGGGSYLANISFAVGFGMLYAAFSWHVVEKPILRRKKEIIAGFRWRKVAPLEKPAAVD